MFFHTAVLGSEGLIAASGARDLADSEGIILLSFDKVDETAGFTHADQEFFDAALQETQTLSCVDDGRLFAVGHGLGGHTARRVACRLPIAGVATVGDWTRVGEWECPAKQQAPFIHFSGLDDTYMPVRGGSSCLGEQMMALESIELRNRASHQCGDSEQSWKRTRKGKCVTWDCERPFVSCTYDGGHFWPGGGAPSVELPGCPAPLPEFPIMETIWEFFAAQPSTATEVVDDR